MSRRARSSGLAAGASLVALILIAPAIGATDDTLPSSISDRDFWSLTEQLSEPNGFFQSDNLLSNETSVSAVAALLPSRVKPVRVYIGVWPAQNITYIAASSHGLAFHTDIRRGNLHLHLMYKALFELSADRAEFVSRLFTKPRPKGLTAESSATDLMNAYWDIESSTYTAYQANLDAIKDVLVRAHGFPLSREDLDGIEYVYHSFYLYGPRITYSSSTVGTNARGVTYTDLMTSFDPATNTQHSYLSSEENFTFLKSLEKNNLIVPVVGDFAGPKALRAVGKYIRDHGAVVSTFYVSNVESYLQRNNVWPTFCANVATLPLDDTSSFIRPSGNGSIYYFNTTSNPQTAAQLNRLFAVVNGANGPTISPFAPIASEVAACGSR